MRRFWPLAAALGCVLCSVVSVVSPARAGEVVDVVMAGLLYHNAPLGGPHREDGVDGNLEVQFASPSFLKFLFSPRPHLGADINFEGKTSSLYGGLTWGLTLSRTVFGGSDALFVTGSLGGAVHDGKLDTNEHGRLSMGSRALFRESIELGYFVLPYQITSIFVDHISNARLANRNVGLTNIGMRIGWTF